MSFFYYAEDNPDLQGCSNTTCLNNARCVNSYTSHHDDVPCEYTCICEEGYSGANCAKPAGKTVCLESWDVTWICSWGRQTVWKTLHIFISSISLKRVVKLWVGSDLKKDVLFRLIMFFSLLFYNCIMKKHWPHINQTCDVHGGIHMVCLMLF